MNFRLINQTVSTYLRPSFMVLGLCFQSLFPKTISTVSSVVTEEQTLPKGTGSRVSYWTSTRKHLRPVRHLNSFSSVWNEVPLCNINNVTSRLFRHEIRCPHLRCFPSVSEMIVLHFFTSRKYFLTDRREISWIIRSIVSSLSHLRLHLIKLVP